MADQTLHEHDSDETIQEPAAENEAAGNEPADPAAGLRSENQALQDRLLRLAAEFDNYRKRIDRERKDTVEYAAADLIREILPIIDNFERALQADATAATAFRKGVEMIHEQMLDLLRKRGVRPVDAVGLPFDPNIHEAVAHEPSSTHAEGEVIEELQRGYMLGERLLRPSVVKVAKGL